METMKYLKCLYLNRIKGLAPESGKIEFSFKKGINVIFGTNGSGKTRILDTIRTFFSNQIKTAWLRTENTGDSEMELYIDDGSQVSADVLMAIKQCHHLPPASPGLVDSG